MLKKGKPSSGLGSWTAYIPEYYREYIEDIVEEKEDKPSRQMYSRPVTIIWRNGKSTTFPNKAQMHRQLDKSNSIRKFMRI